MLHPCVSLIKYFGVTFDEKITWRMHVEIIDAKAFIILCVYSLLKSKQLHKNTLILHKAPMRSIMTNACPDF